MESNVEGVMVFRVQRTIYFATYERFRGMKYRDTIYRTAFLSRLHFRSNFTDIHGSLSTVYRKETNHDDPGHPGDHGISLQAACPETSIALTNVIEHKIKFYPLKSK